MAPAEVPNILLNCYYTNYLHLRVFDTPEGQTLFDKRHLTLRQLLCHRIFRILYLEPVSTFKDSKLQFIPNCILPAMTSFIT